MKISKVDQSNLEQAISLVHRLNQAPAHNISYFGETRKEIEADFTAVQPPEGYGFIAISDEGKINGFFGIEMDLELGRSWLFGPLVDDPEWDSTADDLYQAIIAELPAEIADQELFFHGQNVNLQNFALRHGFTYHTDGVVLILDVNERQIRELQGMSEFSEEYGPQLEALHAELFPGTYYSAKQLIELARQEDKLMLIHQKQGNLDGYIFVQIRPASQDVYIDFLGIDQQHRRQGIAQGLVAQAVDWAVKKSDIRSITLTVNSDNLAAINLYQSLGFITQTISQAYKKRT